MLQRLRITLFFVLALSVLSGTARAGSRYFFCSMMGQTRTDACCVRHTDHDSSSPAVEKTTHACCESYVVGELPASILESAARIAPPSLTTAPQFSLTEDHWYFPKAELSEFLSRPPNLPDARSRTMVFLI